MQTLSYGFLLPETGDNGSIFFPALEDNIEQLNDHNHDGNNSAKLGSQSFEVTTQTISSVGWVGSSGVYSQVVTIPDSIQFDDVMITLRDSTSGDYYNLTIEKTGASTYRVRINDNTISLKARYSP